MKDKLILLAKSIMWGIVVASIVYASFIFMQLVFSPPKDMYDLNSNSGEIGQ